MKKSSLLGSICCISIALVTSCGNRYTEADLRELINEVLDERTFVPTNPFDSLVIGNTGIANGYGFVDLTLPSGTLWAWCNIGATTPEEYGKYFVWGETDILENVSTWSHKFGEKDNFTKYNQTDSTIVLSECDDAAFKNWGNRWRIPTMEEQKELIAHCTWKKVTYKGVKGYKIAGKNGNSIFLPAAGYLQGSKTEYSGEYGDYLSSQVYKNEKDSIDYNKVFHLYFYMSGSISQVKNGCYGTLRYGYKHSIRPVLTQKAHEVITKE